MDAVLVPLVGALALSIAIALPLYAGQVRGRRYAIFAAVLLAFSLPGVVLMHGRLTEALPEVLRPWNTLGFLLALLALGTHLGSLVTPKLRRPAFRLGVSIPGQVAIAGGFFAGVWLLALAPLRGLLLVLGADGLLDALRWADLLPFAVALVSVVTSTRHTDELVRVALASNGPEQVTRVPVERYRRRRPDPLPVRPLRVVQISDPHLGPWQPLGKLRRHVDERVALDPDLILLTGDFLTMEGGATPGALAAALEPLRKAHGRTFAIFGNHDHEHSEEVRNALESNGVRLLVDDEARVETAVGPVQIVGADYVGRGREEHIRALLQRFPRRPDELRLFLLHDPLGFQYVPKGDVDLTLSGHTHGGQVGLVSLGLDWTVLSRSRWPDHGLFGHGANRLYVHRGTGFYGFPLRVGVPGESSLLEIVPADH